MLFGVEVHVLLVVADYAVVFVEVHRTGAFRFRNSDVCVEGFVAASGAALTYCYIAHAPVQVYAPVKIYRKELKQEN